MKKEFASKWAICVCIAVMGSTTACGDLANGDFSITDPSDPGFGWTLSGAEVEPGIALFEESPPNGPDLMTLSQDVTLEPGNYVLSYDVSFYSSGKGETDFFVVLWGSTQLLSMNNEGIEDYASLYGLTEGTAGGPDAIWYYGTVKHSLAISSTSPTNLLKFSLDPDNKVAQGPDWENPGDSIVSIQNVNVVPVPGSVLLGGLGLAVANWRLKRRKAG